MSIRLSIFPLPGAILFPALQLPLHVFEPRYLDGGPDGDLSTTDDNTRNPDWDGGANNGSTIVNRGTAGRTPWTQKLDLNVAWRPAFAQDRLMFKVDVFNVFNSRKAVTVNEFGEDAGGNPQPNIHQSANGWQTPRAVRFMVQYEF